MHGSISRKTDKGFGFIQPDNGDKDIFFHAREVIDGIFGELQEGEAVGFEALEGVKGRFATNVRRNGNSQEEDVSVPDAESDSVAAQVRRGLRAFSDYLVRMIAQKPSTLDHIEWRQLEVNIAEIFEGLGFDVQLTESAKDGGKDVVVSYFESGVRRRFFIEIKHWRSGKRVGQRVADNFVHVLAREKTDGGLLLATSGFSQRAIEHMLSIERVKIGAGELEKIVCLCRTYVKAKEGTWLPPDRLEDVIFEETAYKGERRK